MTGSMSHGSIETRFRKGFEQGRLANPGEATVAARTDERAATMMLCSAAAAVHANMWPSVVDPVTACVFGNALTTCAKSAPWPVGILR